jgi:phospho-2-dehydro-3-deoxyheptonate aldolase
MPVGFKNGTSGATQVAVDAMISASNPHQVDKRRKKETYNLY